VEKLLVNSREREGERGNVLVISFLLVTLLTALATAHFATVQKSSRQSNFVNDLGDLRRYAETGVQLAIHELTYDVGSGDGNIGTSLWTTANDVGKDGYPSTNDEGEGDGIPTPGEPNLAPASIGPAGLGIGLLVRTADTAWPNVKRIVSTAYNTGAIATVEVYAQAAVKTVAGVGAVYAQPGVVLDLKGSAFKIDGHDVNPNGTPGPSPTVYGITTAIGTPPGSNASNLSSQVPLKNADQIIGQGSDPSIGESGALDFDRVFNNFKAVSSNVVAPGSYNDVAWGNNAANSYEVTYCNGDLTLGGSGKGAGTLIVEGSLTLTGTFDFVGLVIVKGDVRLRGGGGGIHVWGSLMIGQTLTAIDPTADLSLNGTADVWYSSAALAKAASLLGNNYNVLYWNDLK
jgi:hypothetical protein